MQSLVRAGIRSLSTETRLPLRMADRVAVVTGAAGGIGRESCLLFAREGARIVVADLNEAEGMKTVNMVCEAGTCKQKLNDH